MRNFWMTFAMVATAAAACSQSGAGAWQLRALTYNTQLAPRRMSQRVVYV